MVLYLLLCVISVLVGCGILALIGVDVDRRNNLFLTPVITLCTIALFMGGLVAGGFSVGKITPYVYMLCFGAAVVGVVRHGKSVLASWRSLLILAGLPLLILLPTLIEGFENYAGGPCSDNWSYVTVGQSLQRYPLGADGWFPINVQYSAQWGKATRFISPAFLAFLAPLSGEHNDTQEVLGQYVGWLFFAYGSACLFFAKAARLKDCMAWAVVLLVALSGWNLKIVNANSIDNALAICFLPAVLGILIVIASPSVRYGIVLGMVLAAGLYAYPESAPFTIVAILAMATQRMISAPHQLREYGRMGIAFLVTVFVSILPYAPQIASFFHRETTLLRGAVGERPGEVFYQSLLAPGYVLPAYWGLIPEFDGRLLAERYLSHYNLYALIVTYILTLAALLGMFLLIRRRDWSVPLLAAGMTAAYAIALMHLHYPYLAYKLLALIWFAIAYIVVVAAEYIWETLGRGSSRWMGYTSTVVSVVLLTAIAGSFFLQERIFYYCLPLKSLREIKKVSVVENLTHGAPIALIANETYANIWGAHFLRKSKLYLAGQYRGYMAGLVSFLSRAEPVDPSDIRFVVTDSERSFESKRLLARMGPYYVWDCGHGPWALWMEFPNAMPGGGIPKPFFLVGKGDTELSILSSAATPAVISAKFNLGDSATGNTQRRLLVGNENFEKECVIGNGKHSFTVPLQPGLNRILLRSLEEKSSLIRVSHLSIITLTKGDRPQIREIENPNGLERWNGTDPFFWMGVGDTKVTVSASMAGIAQLRATLVPGPSLVDKSQARVLIVAPSHIRMERSLNWGLAKIDIPVQPGLNTIVIRAIGSHGANVTAPRDPRIMMIGFRNLQISDMVKPSKSK